MKQPHGIKSHFHVFLGIMIFAALPGCAPEKAPTPSAGKRLKTKSSLVEVDMGEGKHGLLVRKELDLDDYNRSVHSDRRGLDEPPRIILMSQPRYPAALKEKKIEGFAKLVFVVDENGAVVSAKVKNASRPEFGLAAVQSVLRWRYLPMKRNNVPVRMTFTQTFDFSLD
ncbi:energy transducer TonB [Luteolibacter yonseiensis]|uniref:Energy transducer TonB n=1 Tax=Luteolibacter yonseiensis TaxID=1144680 RepID=A0A934R4J7_9BACT|nr:energy transducer TonB [Luteolibacter yonseiensis]MBK1815908.1 energy transducer TonB [Luteolibacter yonseiensis]